jgi:hypothetical protein
MGKHLGEGGYASVHMARWTYAPGHERDIAVKMMKVNDKKSDPDCVADMLKGLK